MKRKLLALLMALTLLLTALPAVLAEDEAPAHEEPAPAKMEQAPAKETPAPEPAKTAPEPEPVKAEPAPEAKSEPEQVKSESEPEARPAETEPEPGKDEPAEDTPSGEAPELSEEPHAEPGEPDESEPTEDRPVVVIPPEQGTAEPTPLEEAVPDAYAREESEDEAFEIPVQEEYASCEHANVKRKFNRKAKNIAYTDLGDGTHRVTGKAVVSTVCQDCGKTLKTYDSLVESCAYMPTKNGLVCAYCGHVEGDNGAHIHSFTDGPYYFAGDYVDTAPSRDNPTYYHVERYAKLVVYKCAQCGTIGSAEVVPGAYIEENRSHVWKNGICQRCGYACGHPDDNIVENTYRSDPECTAVDEDNHRVERVERYRISCGLCGAVLFEDVQRLGSYDEPHDFEDGVCVLCGYADEDYEEDTDDGWFDFFELIADD